MSLPPRNTRTSKITTIFDNGPGNGEKNNPMANIWPSIMHRAVCFSLKRLARHALIYIYIRKRANTHSSASRRCVKSAIIHKSWSRRPTAVSSEQTRVLIVFTFCLECHEGDSPWCYPRMHLDSSGFEVLAHICTLSGKVHSAPCSKDPIIRLSDVCGNIILKYSVECIFALFPRWGCTSIEYFF